MKNKHAGFTLLELLIVIFIIGIATTVISLRSSGQHGYRELQSFAEILKAQMQVAREQAIVQMSVIGLTFQSNNYEFYQYNKMAEQQWMPLANTDNFWKIYSIPTFIQLDFLQNETNNFNKNSSKQIQTPQIIFSPSGEITPFTLTLANKKISPHFKLISNGVGSLVLEEFSE